MSNRRLALRSLAWAAVESGGLSVLMLVTTILLARLLGPAEFGVAALALGIVQLLNLLVEMLFHDAIVQRTSLDEDHLDTALWTSMGLAVVLVGACWLAAPQLAALFDEPALASILGWMSLGLLFNGASGVLIASYRREMRFKPVALRSLYGRLLGAAVGITMAFAGFGVWSLVAQHVCATAMATVWVWASAVRRPRLRYSVRKLCELLSFAISTFLTQLVMQGNSRLFTVLLGYFLGATALGYFNIAMKLVEMFRHILLNAVAHVALVLFSRMQQNRAKLRWAFKEATELNAAVVMPAFAGMAVCAEEIVHLVLGPQWQSAVLLLQISAIGALGGTLRQFAPVVYKAIGRPHLTLIASIVNSVLAIGGLLLFGTDSLVIAAIVWAGHPLISLPASLWLLRRVLGVGIGEQLRSISGPSIATGVMVAVLYAVKHWLIADWPDLYSLTFVVLLGIAVYLLAVAAVAPQLSLRIRSLAMEALRKGGAPATIPSEESPTGSSGA